MHKTLVNDRCQAGLRDLPPEPAAAKVCAFARGRWWVVSGSTKAVALIRFYQRTAPAQVRGRCRFTPTCSEYAVLAIEKYGLARGSVRAFRRVLRCRSPHGGIDEP